MKKWLIGASLVVLTLLLCSYLIIPGAFTMQHKSRAAVQVRSFQRAVLENANWEKWWPGTTTNATGTSLYTYNGYTYTVLDQKLTTITFAVSNGEFSVKTHLHCIPISADSIEFSWEAHKSLSAQPVRRWQAYLQSRHLDKDLKDILNAMTAFYANPDNIYGWHIQKALVVDSILFSTYAISKGYPTPGFVYELVDQLKRYIAGEGAEETGYPMLNVSTEDSLNYLTKVAIPVDRKLKSAGNMTYRWMLGGGNILITEVKGGPHAIQAAYRQVEHYIMDYQRVAPAIPFESLVTDRRQIPDTAQWVTRICYPVM